MNSGKKLFFVFLFLIAAATAGAGGVSPTVLFPPDLSLSTDGKARLFVYSPDKSEPKVTLNFKPLPALEGEVFRKGEISLNPGLNFLEVGDKRVRIYSLPNAKMDKFSLAGKKSDEVFVFQTYKLHPALDDGCEGCHTVEGDKISAKPLAEACYACHTDFTKADEGKEVFVHTPVKGAECTGCHDPHFSSLAKLQKSEKGCRECHDPFPEEGTVHKPVSYGDCTSCHSPHAGPGDKQLLRPGNSLCIACHETPHPQHRSAEIKGRLTQIPPDFPLDNTLGRKEMACTGCHQAHQSPERRLFKKSQGELCKTCHRL